MRNESSHHRKELERWQPPQGVNSVFTAEFALHRALMGRSLPHVLVYPYVGTSSKERFERYTLQEFCNAMARQHEGACSVVRRPVQRGLIRMVSGATVDGVVRTEAGTIAVELLSLSPRRDRGDMMGQDLAFRKRLRRSVGLILRARSWSLQLWYRDGRRHDGTSVKMVPQNRQQCAEVAGELRRLLLCDAPAPREPGFVFLHFVSLTRDRCALVQRGGRHYFPSHEFPACARHLDHVVLQGLPRPIRPVIDRDLKAGMVGANAAFLNRKLADKAERSLGLSKERANGLPLWLVVHSDGRGIHQSIAPPQRGAAVETCRTALSNLEHAFARAYWADRTGFRNAAWVGRIL